MGFREIIDSNRKRHGRVEKKSVDHGKSFVPHVSRLICLPNLAYSSTLSCVISS